LCAWHYCSRLGFYCVSAIGRFRRDAFELPLAPQVCLEFGRDPNHVQEALSGGRGSVDRLLCGL
jgi:hypothetical protein